MAQKERWQEIVPEHAEAAEGGAVVHSEPLNKVTFDDSVEETRLEDPYGFYYAETKPSAAEADLDYSPGPRCRPHRCGRRPATMLVPLVILGRAFHR